MGGGGEASRWQPARLCIGAGLNLEKKMGNSRIFHDFRPLGVRASQDPDHHPRWAGVRASGRLTEGPFSWATGGQAGAGGRAAWREQAGPQKSYSAPCCWAASRGQSEQGRQGCSRPSTGGRATLLPPPPAQKRRVCSDPQRQMRETEAWRAAVGRGPRQEQGPGRAAGSGRGWEGVVE